MSASSTATAGDGRASVTWTLGTTAGGDHSVGAGVSGVSPVTFTATAEPGELAAVEAVPASAELDAIGDTAIIVAAAVDEYGNPLEDIDVAFRSLDEAVATVDAEGVVTAESNGTAGIVAEAGAAADTTTVTVEQVAASVRVEPRDTALAALGDSVSLTATVLDANDTPIEEPGVTWSSTDEAVATVSEEGVVTAEGNGTAGIVAAADEAADTATVTVAQAAASLTIEPEDTTLTALGDSVSLTVTVRDPNDELVENPDVAWSSSDEAVATVSDAGVVMAEGNGSAEIVAAANGVADTATVTVEQAVASVEVEPEDTTLTALGDSVSLTAAVRDANGVELEAADVTWSSSDEAVATVDADGLVTAQSNGTAGIVAEADGAADTATVTVEQVAASIDLAPDAVVLTATGDSVPLTPTVRDANAVVLEEPGVTWSSSDEAVATVSADGVVTAQGEGEAEIRVETGEVSATLVVTVQTGQGVARDWVGGAEGDPVAWENPLNWAPAGAPNGQDTARIGGDAADTPVLLDDAEVDRVEVESGATLDLNGHTLTANALVVDGTIKGGGAVVLEGDDATVQGEVPALRVVGTARLTGTTTAVGGLTIAGGSLDLDGFALTVRKR